MVLGRAQVLADGEDIDAYCGKIAEDVEQFVCFLAHADDDAGLGYLLGIEFLRQAQVSDGALIAAT